VRDASGQLLGYEGMVEDITERKQVEESTGEAGTLLGGAEVERKLLTLMVTETTTKRY